MNNRLQIFSLSLIFMPTVFAEYGCMDTSYHLAQLNDPKDYYYVTGADGGPCSCPCSRYCAIYKCSLARGQCPVCKHYRVPRPLIIVKGTKVSQELRPAKTSGRYTIPFMRKKITSPQSSGARISTH